MTPSGNGRYCSVCSKVVVDFTKMSDEEMKDYFTTYSEQNACGSFYTQQLENKPTGNVEKVVLNWYKRSEQQIKLKMVRVAAVFAIGIILTIMGCRPKRLSGAYAYNTSSIRYVDMDTTLNKNTQQPSETPIVDPLKTPH